MSSSSSSDSSSAITTRRLILLSFWSSILLGLPFWWKTTTIQRLSLPSKPSQLKGGSEEPCPVVFPVGVDERVLRRCGGEFWERECLRPVVVREEEEGSISRPDLGESEGGCETWSTAPNHFLNPISDGKSIKYAPTIRLVFSLLNEDASSPGGAILPDDSDGKGEDWGLDNGFKDYILPYLESLSPLFNFTVETQLRLYAPLNINRYAPPESPGGDGGGRGDSSESTFKNEDGGGKEVNSEDENNTNNNKYWTLNRKDLKAFVNPDWNLVSSGGDTLHFTLYIPRPDRPTIISNPTTIMNPTDPIKAFMIPQWGGVVILNAEDDADTTTTTITTETMEMDRELNKSHFLPNIKEKSPVLKKDKIKDSFSLFGYQLGILLGIPIPPSTSSLSLPTSSQIQSMLRSRILENLKDSIRTLDGIGIIVAENKGMRIGNEVRRDVERGWDEVVWAKSLAESNSSPNTDNLTQTLHLSLIHSSRARKLANRAFFTPSMLALLYFPEEHKYAVYTPLFGTIGVPLIAALVKEIKASIKRRKKERIEGTAKKDDEKLKTE